MKKLIVAILLVALMVANISACGYVSQNEYREYGNNTNSTEIAFTNTNEKTNAELEKNPSPSIDIEGESRNSDFLYTVNEDGAVTIKSYYGNDSVLILPDYIDGKPVTQIDSWSFSGCDSLESVVLNDGLLEIGSYSFQYCSNLKTLTIPESVIDGGYRLYDSSIEIIYGAKGTFAETCAAKNSIDFVDSQAGYTREYSKEPVNPTILDYFDFAHNYPIICFGNTKGSDALVGYDRYGQCYVHIPAWNACFQVKLQGEPRDALISGDHLWIISSSEDGSQITTYKFLEDGTLIESYSNTFPFKANENAAPYCDSWLYNCYQEDAFYAFFIKYGNSVSYNPNYVMYQFLSTDGGKTWKQTDGYQATFSDDDIWVLDFFTNDIGVVATRAGYDNFATFVYVTFDGGGTWSPMEDLPYPAEWGDIEEFYLESITYESNEYIFIVRLHPEKGPSQITTFVSKDFFNWEMKEHYLMDQ